MQIWEGIKKFNKANDEFLHILNQFKINLALTPRALTNNDIKEQLLLALLSDITW
ncbi:uncharacterized protein K441DRAFT_672238 [Cenococcum geophilum 1.58]|uniref:Uncharacterized protein n=1 Tax=Cenococcum geophilum 1.58 TaxID=794803 RepID=A0ACC8ELY2_9PEZI|nr:hypothetical protein K441DRAFT_672238 [Cenococcum geophilum 1.58]